MDCLKDYIGLSSRVDATAESGLYVDALPDISLILTDKTTEKGETVEELWGQVEKRGILKFRTLFINELNRCHRIADVKVAECLICKNKELLATSLWYLLGAELLTENLGSPRINRHTTIDRDRNRDFRSELMSTFYHELAVAVEGIDIHSSSCIESEIAENNLITTQIPVI